MRDTHEVGTRFAGERIESGCSGSDPLTPGPRHSMADMLLDFVMTRFFELRHNCAMESINSAIFMQDSAKVLLSSIQYASEGITLNKLLSDHPQIARRTAQRQIADMIAAGQIEARGKGRARRYFATAPMCSAVQEQPADGFPAFIQVSADSQDILQYIDQPLELRHPVGYQRDFLDSYQPNKTWYLSAALRSQLHKMGQPHEHSQPAGTYSRAILNRLLIDLSWASSHLEGNTYSRLDTRDLIEYGRQAQGKNALETQMILNHKSAIELLVENIESAQFNRFTLMNLHSALSENLLPNPADEGRIRQHGVDIGKSVYRPLSASVQLGELLDRLLAKANQITDVFEQSFFMMVHLPYLQPFADINKRTSRLAANLPLFRANLCPLTFLDVPEQAYSRAILGVCNCCRVYGTVYIYIVLYWCK